MDTPRPCWMVYRVGARGPKQVHPLQADAEAEARRIAKLFPQQTVVTLRAEGAWRLGEDGNLVWFDARYALQNSGASNAN